MFCLLRSLSQVGNRGFSIQVCIQAFGAPAFSGGGEQIVLGADDVRL